MKTPVDLFAEATLYEALVGAMIYESKYFPTHGHVRHAPSSRNRIRTQLHTYDALANYDQWKNAKRYQAGVVKAAFDRVKSDFKRALLDATQGYRAKKYNANEMKVLSKVAFDNAYTSAYALGLRAAGLTRLSMGQKTATSGPTMDPHDKEWLKSSVAHERRYWNEFVSSIISGSIDAKWRAFTMEQRVEFYVRTLDHVYETARVVGHPVHTIFYWTLHPAEHCIAESAWLVTDQGLLTMKEAAKTMQCRVATGMTNGLGNIRKVISKGHQPVLCITTHLGYHLEGTNEHRIVIYDVATKNLAWKTLGQIKRGDLLVMTRGQFDRYGAGRHIDPEIAELLGFIEGNGYYWHEKHATRKTPRQILGYLLDRRDMDLWTRYNDALLRNGMETFRANNYSGSNHVLNIRTGKLSTIKTLRLLGAKSGFSEVIRAFSPDSLAAYLRGLFEADGSCGRRKTDTKLISISVCFSSAKETFIRDIQMALFSLGILSRIYKQTGNTNFKQNRTLWTLKILGGANLVRFIERINFASRRKRLQLREVHEKETRGDTFPVHEKKRASVGQLIEMNVKNHKIQEWLTSDIHFARAVTLKKLKPREVYDVLDSSTHTFSANGFLVHNCDGCIMLADNSPYTRETLPAVPRSGATQCLANCKCELRVVTPSNTNQWDQIRKQGNRNILLAKLKSLKRR